MIAQPGSGGPLPGVGEVFAERFEILGVAGSGGMGLVCRARDRVDGQTVGLKILRLHSGLDTQRFGREARLLSSLSHPAIVRHLSHGITPDGVSYLAMEWLEGEDLAARLARQGLTVKESIALVRRAATALALAHGRGIIHRDIKPGNLFLVGGDPRQVKVLDFGIARPALSSMGMTRTGAMVGTLGYIAPEQACGERELDSRVDVFSLGCVLFECLTGEPAFRGARPVAVLAKILFGEPPHVRELRPDLPGPLDEAVARLMAKDRDKRPPDAAAVVLALDRLDPLASAPPPSYTPAEARVLTTDEQRFLSVILVSPQDVAGSVPGGDSATVEQSGLAEVMGRLRAAAEPLGGQLTSLATGAVLVTLKGSGTAKDLAVRAAACALALRAAAGDALICLATGPLEVTGEWPAGQVIDRVATLQDTGPLPGPGHGGVLVDDVTAALLDARFEVVGSGPVRVLTGTGYQLGVRRLLGKPTKCVGRERELAFLQSVFTDCATDDAASAVLVTGPAGGGKTRLAHEFVEWARGQPHPPRILLARGDPVYTGAAFGLASQLVRHAAGLDPSAGPAARHAALRAALTALVDGEDVGRLSEFLGELVGAPTPDEPSPWLLAARNDPRVKNEQLRTAFVDLIGALCTDRPLLIVLDGLHWGDPTSISFLHEALRRYAEAPLMVLALARPEVADAFPDLWAGVELQRLGLGGLKRRAAIALVRAVLGDGLPDDVVRKAVEQAGGNAFFLEELIRRLAEHGTVDFPDSVLAMAQSRLEALDAEARRILRAGSVFGRVFWDGAVSALVGDELPRDDLAAWLDSLVAGEILEPSRSSKFHGQRELAFRQDLLCEAAYAMLTGADRRLGHRLAAGWLEQAGETEALVIAEHFEKGGQPELAIPYLVRAAQAAFDAGDIEAALALSNRGLSHGAAGHDRSRLLLFHASQDVWRGDFSHLSGSAREALDLLPEGSTEWFMALAVLAFAGAFGGDAAALRKVDRMLQAFESPLPPIAPVGYSAIALTASLLFLGRADEARRLCRRLEDAIDRSTVPDPIFLAYRHLVCGWLAFHGLAPLGEALPNVDLALEQFEAARNDLSVTVALYSRAVALLVTGELEQSERTGREVAARCRLRGVGLIERWATWVVGKAQLGLGRFEESLATIAPLLGSEDHILAVSARLTRAMALLATGRASEAEREAQAAWAAADLIPERRAEASAVLAEASLRLGRPAEALDRARTCLGTLVKAAAEPLYVSLAYLTEVEALEALGQHDAARRALRLARDRLLEQAASIGEPGSQAFLTTLHHNARTLALAAARLDHP